MRTRVKICGITRVEDALAAARAGADAIGLVFYAESPRAVTAARAREIVAALPPFVTSVGLFVNAGADAVHAVLETVPLDLLQFHGDEGPEQCRAFGRPYLKALRMREGIALDDELARYGDAAGILLDAFDPAAYGGTGEAFDWSLIPADLARPLVLAGGLDPGNVAEAVRRVRPWAVDVSSGVEAAKGIKDADRITAFCRALAEANRD